VKAVPFEATRLVRDTCLCLAVQRAARTLARRFDAAFKLLGLNHGQFSLLMSLNRPVPAGMKDVAELLAMDRTTLTAAVQVLERRSLVSVAVNPRDQRGRLLTLTPAGRRVLAKALPIWKRQHAQIQARLAGSPDLLRQGLAAVSARRGRRRRAEPA
jgi:DNA-binding MarR family transcriptional regulator